MKLEKTKSTRHSKIAGDFAEHLICYWLSKREFQPVIVDYTGIDIVAYNKKLNKRLGISVKSRTRQRFKSEKEVITIDFREFPLIEEACKFFDAEPYFGIVVDQDNYQRLDFYIIPYKDIKEINLDEQKNKRLYIKVSERFTKQYEALPNAIVVKMEYKELLDKINE